MKTEHVESIGWDGVRIEDVEKALEFVPDDFLIKTLEARGYTCLGFPLTQPIPTSKQHFSQGGITGLGPYITKDISWKKLEEAVSLGWANPSATSAPQKDSVLGQSKGEKRGKKR